MSSPGAATSGNGLSPDAATTAGEQVYDCPMHPEVVGDKPGSCPKCGMDLVLKASNNELKSQ